MDKEILREMIKQHRVTSHFSFDRVTEDNAVLRLNEGTASIGFIYRHVGETINLFAQMLGTPTDVTNTTIGQTDVGQQYGVGQSRELIERGYRALHDLVETSTEADWLAPVETPFFGRVSRVRLFAHTLFHTSHHAGQISLTLARGSVPERGARDGAKACRELSGIRTP
jgi:uncharacterized damage-inducible protein DinB